MNMNWTRPRAEVQQFATNEYVSACGEHGTTYGFKCNAGNPHYGYNVFLNGEFIGEFTYEDCVEDFDMEY